MSILPISTLIKIAVPIVIAVGSFFGIQKFIDSKIKAAEEKFILEMQIENKKAVEEFQKLVDRNMQELLDLQEELKNASDVAMSEMENRIDQIESFNSTVDDSDSSPILKYTIRGLQ